MHILLDRFHQCRKYTEHVSSHEEELRREENLIDQKCLSILSLQTYYLNFDNSSVYGGKNEREDLSQEIYIVLEVPTTQQRNVLKI